MKLIIRQYPTNLRLVINDGGVNKLLINNEPEILKLIYRQGSFNIGNTNGSINISAGTTSNNLTNAVFSNSNGVTFGLNGSTITASVNSNAGGAAISAGGSSQNSGTIIFSNSNGVSFGLNNGTLTASAVGGAGGGVALSAGTNSTSTGTVIFSNSNNVTFGMSTNGVITATATFNQTQFVLSNSNGISFGTNGSTVTASYTVPTITNSSATISADTRSETLSQLVFSNSNGISFGLTGGTITGTVKTDYLTTQTVQTQNVVDVSLSGNTAGVLALISSGTMIMAGGNNITVSQNGNSVTISGANAGGAQTAISGIIASNTTYTSGTVSFKDGNGISFGTSTGQAISITHALAFTSNAAGTGFTSAGTNVGMSGTLTSNGLSLSVTVAAQTNQTVGLYGSSQTTGSASSGTLDARSISIIGAGIVSVGMHSTSAGGTTTGFIISATQSNQAFSASGGSSAFQTLNFANSNGLTFSNTNGSVVASYTIPTITNSSWTVSDSVTSATVGRLAFTASNGLTLTLSTSNNGNHTVIGSYTVPTVTNSSLTMQAGASTLSSVSRIAFVDSNGVSFGASTSNNGSITITATVKTDYLTTQTNQTVGLYGSSQTTGSASSGTLDARSISIIGAGIISVGMHSTSAGGTTTGFIISATQSNQAFSASGGSTTFQTLNFANSNGVTFSNTNGSVIASYTVPTVTNSSWTVSDAATSATVGRLAFTNSNGLTLSLSTSNNGNHTVIGSYTVPTVTNSSLTMQAGASTLSSVSRIAFVDSNGVSFGASTSNNGSITITATVKTDYLTTQTNQDISWFGLGNTTQNSSSVINASKVSLNGLGIITVGYSNGSIQVSATQSNQTIGGYVSGNTGGQSSSSTFDARSFSVSGMGNLTAGYSGGMLIISGGTAAAAPVNVSAGTTSNNLSQIVFSNSNGVSFGLNGSTVTASAAGGGIALGNSETTYTSGTAIMSVVGGAMTIASTTGQSFNFSVPQTSSLSGTGLVSISANVSTISIGVAGTTLSNFEPYDFGLNVSSISNDGIGTMNVMPFRLWQNLSFGQINVIASASFPVTSAANTMSFSVSANSSLRFGASFSISNSNYVDVYLFSKLGGGSTTNLGTYASTRNTFGTLQNHSYDLSVNKTGGNSGSYSIRSTVSVSVTFPFVTSGTQTSGNAATTITTWGTGYSSWTSTASNSSSNTFATNALPKTDSLASTWPATTAWASMKLINLNFGTSLSAGEWWIGINRQSATSSSSSTASSNGAAGNTYTSSINASNLTYTAQLTYAGITNTIANSLGFLGGNTNSSVMPSVGHGSFSATYSPDSTYVNNAGQANGVIAISDIRSNANFFKTWIQFNSVRVAS